MALSKLWTSTGHWCSNLRQTDHFEFCVACVLREPLAIELPLCGSRICQVVELIDFSPFDLMERRRRPIANVDVRDSRAKMRVPTMLCERGGSPGFEAGRGLKQTRQTQTRQMTGDRPASKPGVD